MTITDIDKTTCKMLAEAVAENLEEFAAEHGLTIKVEGGRYDPTAGTFSPKVTFAVADAERRAFERDVDHFCVSGASNRWLEADDYGVEFAQGGKTFRLTGFNLRAPRFPLEGESNGKRYKFTEAAVRTALGR